MHRRTWLVNYRILWHEAVTIRGNLSVINEQPACVDIILIYVKLDVHKAVLLRDGLVGTLPSLSTLRMGVLMIPATDTLTERL